jgi:hypothetical protein
MSQLPKVIASSVVRSTVQGQSHGGVYLVDLESEEVEQVIDWNDPSISWEGRGSDRGLRGIAIHVDRIYLAASDEIFVFDKYFHLLKSYRNRYLKHCHETSIADGVLYLTSTGFNSILELNLARESVVRGYRIDLKAGTFFTRYRAVFFDPNKSNGPESDSSLHLNNVTRHGSAITVAGTRVEALLQIEDGKITQYAQLPRGTHNAAVYRQGIIFNDTAAGCIVVAGGDGTSATFHVPTYDPAELTHTNIPNDHARQGFARGLTLAGNDLVIGGSSPSTISVYSISERRRIKSVNLSKDIRNCIHGLELWPY